MTPKAQLPRGSRGPQPLLPLPTTLNSASTAQASLSKMQPLSSWIKIDKAGSNQFADKCTTPAEAAYAAKPGLPRRSAAKAGHRQ